MDRIKEAAVYDPITDQVFTGLYHGKCLEKCSEAGVNKKYLVQGFVTESGEFVNRFEALEIAQKAGQIKKKYPPTDRLLSEDYR